MGMNSKRIGALVLGACLATSCRARAAAPRVIEEQIVLGGLKTTVWSDSAERGKQPVLLFSHGFHGCGTQSRFLMQALAADGFLVFAPNHADATCDGGESSWTEKAAVPLIRPETWDASTYRNRSDDLRRLIEAIRRDERFGPRADWPRLGLVGHSLGGYTVLGMAGAWPEWKLPGVRAVLALSPYAQPFTAKNTLAGLAAPVMYQSGTLDLGVQPALHRELGAFDQSPSPKYYVEFQGAGHLAWTNVGRADRTGILAYSLAFLDRYVKGSPSDPALKQSRSGVAVYRFESELGRL
jgi:predicted dienelactone hydrolase